MRWQHPRETSFYCPSLCKLSLILPSSLTKIHADGCSINSSIRQCLDLQAARFLDLFIQDRRLYLWISGLYCTWIRRLFYPNWLLGKFWHLASEWLNNWNIMVVSVKQKGGHGLIQRQERCDHKGWYHLRDTPGCLAPGSSCHGNKEEAAHFSTLDSSPFYFVFLFIFLLFLLTLFHVLVPV